MTTCSALSRAALLVLVLSSCSGDSGPTQPQDPTKVTYASALNVNLAQMQQTTPGLYIQDVVVGTGGTAVANQTIRVDYTGYLANGKKFDSSLDAGRTQFEFRLGTGAVISGWDLGVPGMRVGGHRRLVIAPSLGYGNQSVGSIPAGSVLVFDVYFRSIR